MQEVFLDSFRRLKGNIIAIVIVCGLVIMPSLYAWFSLLAFWNPEDNTGNLDIAVVNEDAGYRSELIPTKIDAGAQVVDELRGNDKFHWVFTDKDQALDGVKSGDYYAAIVLPEDFSADMVSIFSDKTESPKIEYYANEEANPIAPHLTSIGATTLENDIDKTFTDTVTGVALDANSNLANFMSGQGIEAYVHTLIQKLGEAVEEMKVDAQQVSAFSSLLAQSQLMIETSSSALDGAASVAREAGPLAEQAADSMQSTGSISELAEQAVSKARRSFDAIRTSANQALENMKGDPAAMQSVISAIKGDLEAVKSAYKMARAAVAQIDPSSTVIATIDSIISQIDSLEGELDKASTDLAKGTAEIEDAVSQVNTALDEASAALDEAQSQYGDKLKADAAQVESDLAAVGSKVDEISGQVADTAQRLSSASGPLNSSISEIRESLDATAQLLSDSADSISKSRDELSLALEKGDLDEVRRIIGSDPQKLADMLVSPVQVQHHDVYGVANYGSAMSPFYTSLGLFIGAIFLIIILKVNLTDERREELGNPTHAQEYLGICGFFLVLAIAQAILMCSGNLFFLGVQCDSIPLYYLSGIAASFVFLNIAYALTAAFGDIGKAICVILLVAQVAGSGGELPVQLSAPVFQAIYPWLPFTHSMSLFQGAVAGIYGNQYLVSMLCLLAFVVPALLLGLVLRRPVQKLNSFVDSKLEETKLL